jgi:hypothetical protein
MGLAVCFPRGQGRHRSDRRQGAPFSYLRKNVSISHTTRRSAVVNNQTGICAHASP